MPHTRVIEQLHQNLQTAYRQAIDADASLDELKQAGHAKFGTIFTQKEGFSARSNRFRPYVQELSEELDAFPADIAAIPAAIAHFVPKLGVLLHTLQAFKDQSK